MANTFIEYSSIEELPPETSKLIIKLLKDLIKHKQIKEFGDIAIENGIPYEIYCNCRIYIPNVYESFSIKLDIEHDTNYNSFIVTCTEGDNCPFEFFSTVRIDKPKNISVSKIITSVQKEILDQYKDWKEMW